MMHLANCSFHQSGEEMRYFRIRPTRPFDMWTYSDVENGQIKSLVFAYEYWSAEPIFKQVEYIFVTNSFAEVLSKSDLTGYVLTSVATRKADNYTSSMEDSVPQPVQRLIAQGRAGEADFGMQDVMNLVVSERALGLLRAAGMHEALVYDFDPNFKTPTPDEIRSRNRT
jgi:hypothetical protein